MPATTLDETDRDFDGPRVLFCDRCGYEIVVRRDPPKCPMCRSTEWSTRPGFARWS